MMKPGLYDIDYEEYNSIEAIRSSYLKEAAMKSMAHARQAMIGESQTTPALQFGTDFHTALLTPDRLDREGLKEKDALLIDSMVEAVRNHPIANRFLEGKLESTIVWVNQRTGLLAKCRLDVIMEEFQCYVDFKSTTDASPVGAAKAIANYRYHLQEAWYTEGAGTIYKENWPFLFVFVEKKPPFGIGIYCDDTRQMRFTGKLEIEIILDKWVECKAKDYWPSYPERVQSVQLPNWYWNQSILD